MKTTLTVIALLAALAASALAADQAGMIIDQIVWTSPGGYQSVRAGTLYTGPPRGGSDYVDGTAVCNPNYPFPPPQFSTYIGGGIGIQNNQPVCGALSYYIIGTPVSLRADGNYDHLQWSGAAWYPDRPGQTIPNVPATSEWHAACFQEGTDQYGNPNGIFGEPYIITYQQGLCSSGIGF